MRPNQTNFRNLNRDGKWLDFHWDGLEVRDDGALQLLSVPKLEGAAPAEVAALPVPDGPAGIAIGPDGAVYYTDPPHDRVWVMGGCDGRVSALGCLGGRWASGLKHPRGLLVHPQRNALMVANAGHGRIDVFDLDSWALLDQLGDGVLQEPVAIAADREGNVYAADTALHSVVKFAISGDVVPEFWQNMQASGLVTQPAAVAVWTKSVFVLDLDAKKIFEFDLSGRPVMTNGAPVEASSSQLQQPMGLAVDAQHLWTGDNALRRVLQFDRVPGMGFKFAGEAAGYQGPVAALAFDSHGPKLRVAGGSALPPVSLTPGTGFGARGVLWSDRISITGPPVRWHRLQAALTPGNEESHIRFFVRTSNDSASPAIDLAADPPFPAAQWRGLPYDIADAFLGGEPQRYLWIGAVWIGDRSSSVRLSQIRVEYDHESYLASLPEIYRQGSPCGDFLLRFLALFESFFNEPETALANLARWFDPQSAPAEVLPWLAGWLELDLPGDLNIAGRRKAIERAFANYALRGTARGLRQAIEDSTGVQAVIEEPILNGGWWRLPAPSSSCDAQRGAPLWQDGANSVLGFTTGLASAAPQGAVVGTTSVLDQSNLISDAELGAPLFDGLAYQFSVLVYRGEVECAGKLTAITNVIEREKPAHTLCHVCVVDPQMRVGFQSRLGIDTVVAGPPGPSRLGEGGPSSAALVLAGEPPGMIGISRVGEDTWL